MTMTVACADATQLVSMLCHEVPQGWEITCENIELEGTSTRYITAVSWGISDKVLAVKTLCGNHIEFAVNGAGGDMGEITEWNELEHVVDLLCYH